MHFHSGRVCGRFVSVAALLAVLGSSRSSFAQASPTSGDPAATPTAPSPPKKEDASEAPEHLRVGALVGIGFPRPLAFEGLVKIERTVAVGVEYSLMPKITVGGVETNYWAVAGDVRVFPFQGGFFLGLRAGAQHLGASTTVSVASLGSVSGGITSDTVFVNPRVGFLWTWSPGLSLGIDAGVQIPVATTASSTLPAAIPGDNPVTNVVDVFGRGVLPTVDLLRVGLLL